MNTYQQAVQELSRVSEIVVRTANLRNVAYDPQWIYINRIGKKIRVLSQKDAINNGGTIRNALKITWNPETYTKDQMVAHVQRMMPALRHFTTRGSCHPCRTCSDVLMVLAGCVDESNPRVWRIHGPANGDPKRIKLQILGIS